MGTCSVPRMRQVLPFTSSARPSGTVPPMACISYTAKSTRKLAQQAPQLRHGWAESAVVMVVASSDMQCVRSACGGAVRRCGGGEC